MRNISRVTGVSFGRSNWLTLQFLVCNKNCKICLVRDFKFSKGFPILCALFIDAAPLWADSKSFRCLALCIMYPKTPYSAAEFKFTSYKGWVKEHDAVTSQGRELYATVCYLQFLWCVQSICRVKVRASPIIATAYLSGFTPDQFAWLCCIFNVKKLLQ